MPGEECRRLAGGEEDAISRCGERSASTASVSWCVILQEMADMDAGLSGLTGEQLAQSTLTPVDRDATAAKLDARRLELFAQQKENAPPALRLPYPSAGAGTY